MKANELRIGNFINVPCGNNEYWVRTVEEIRTDSISTENGRWCFDSSEGNEQGFYPIPLTEEWLIRFGFRKNINDIRFWKKGSLNIKKHNKGFQFRWSESLEYIKYVHQLQNLYFALTGEELTLKQ